MPRTLLIVSGMAALALVAAIPIALRHMRAEIGMTNRHGVRATLAAAAAMLMGGHAAAALAVPPTSFGVTLSPPSYYRETRMLANLASAANWGASDRHQIGADEVDKDGNVKKLLPGTTLTRLLTPPNLGARPQVRCTWKGKGEIKAAGRAAQNVQYGAGSLTFTMNADPAHGALAQLKLLSVDPSDPIRDIDCREAGLPADARFDPHYVASLRGFRVIRFMDWQGSNFNAPVTWATRHLPNGIDNMVADGVAIEDMVALARETGAEPWFNMPWNSDDDYYEHFARMVHDNLPADRTVYVELGNEVWNHAFKVAGQAQREGQAANLSSNPNEAGLRRYAQRLAHVMDIWKKVYADRPGRLVRVATCQNGAWCAKTVLSFQDTARHVDAMATAPYFGYRLNSMTFASPDELFAALDPEIERTLQDALAVKAVAAQFGKRYITYEAGQHLIFKDIGFEQRVERDPRMYDAYMKYMNFWRTRIGDLMMLYSSSGSISKYGGWGLIEYIGQPLSEAPKMRAVRDQMALIQGAKTAH